MIKGWRLSTIVVASVDRRLRPRTFDRVDDAHEPRIEIYLPEELEDGVYANTLSCWHTSDEFTLDFAAFQRPREAEDGEVVLWARIAARIKVPVTALFEMIRIMNEAMTRYENEFGEIRPPRRDT